MIASVALEQKDKLIFYLLAVYFSIVLFGTAFRIGGGENWYGISTVVVLAIIALKATSILNGLRENSLLITISALLLWCSITGMFSATSVSAAYSMLATFVGYLLAATAVYKSNMTESRVRILFVTLAISLLVSCALTIVDFLHIYNVPFVNEYTSDTKIAGERIEQIGGFFTKRTSMAAYFSLAIPALIYYALRINAIKERLIILAAAGAGFLTLLLTHNRSGILGIILALFVYLVNDPSVNLGKKIKTLIYASIAFMLLFIIVYLYFPQIVEVYAMKLAAYLPDTAFTSGVKTAQNYVEADYSRIYFFKTVMASLGSNPIGNGFSKIYSEDYGVSSPHNVISWLIWAAGFAAFIWIPVFAYQVRKHFRLKMLRDGSGACEMSLIYISALQVGLFAWVLDNLAHTSLNTGLGWMYLGLVMNLMRKCKMASKTVPVEQTDIGIVPVDGRILRRKKTSGKSTISL